MLIFAVRIMYVEGASTRAAPFITSVIARRAATILIGSY
jgi:hypothetical protein